MTQEVTTISPFFSTPYITVDEYKQAPTAVDVDDLVGGGSYAVNEQELQNVIARACSWIDSHCGQVLAATLDTDAFRARVSRDGFLHIHPRFFPVVGVVAASYGSTPQQMVTLDPDTAWIEPMTISFPLGNQLNFFSGAIQFTPVYSPTAEQFVTVTYVNGYANSLLAANSAVGDMNLSVTDLTGFVPGQKFMVYDGGVSEILYVDSAFTVAQGAGLLPLASAATQAHTSGVSVSAMPPAIKQAAIYMTNVLLKARGSAAVVMGTLTPTNIYEQNPAVRNDYSSAVDILQPYRRIR